jgi:hypothetical protein
MEKFVKPLPSSAEFAQLKAQEKQARADRQKLANRTIEPEIANN